MLTGPPTVSSSQNLLCPPLGPHPPGCENAVHRFQFSDRYYHPSAADKETDPAGTEHLTL